MRLITRLSFTAGSVQAWVLPGNEIDKCVACELVTTFALYFSPGVNLALIVNNLAVSAQSQRTIVYRFIQFIQITGL